MLPIHRTCHSLNPDYSDYDLQLSEVQALFYVERIIDRSMSQW